MTELRLYKSRGKALRLMLGCTVLVGLGFSLGQSWLAWFCIGFFGLGFPVGIFQLLDRRPQIIVNEVGLFDRTMHHEFINWAIIQDVYLATIHKQQALCLVVDEAFEPSRAKNKFTRGVAEQSAWVSGAEYPTEYRRHRRGALC